MFKKLTYRDKNNNTYQIKGTLLSYSGIKPLESSSGTYSGGKDQTITLNKSDLAKLENVVSTITKSTTSTRSMGSSTLWLDDLSFQLAYNSRSQKELELTLQSFIRSTHKQLTHSEHKPNKHELLIHLVLDGLTDKVNIASAFRIAEALGIKKLVILNSGYNELSHQMIKISRHTHKHLEHQFVDRNNFDLQQYIVDNWLILGLEITDKSVDIRSFQSVSNRPILLIIGSEQHGISENLLNVTNTCLHIPMFGQNSSMNVIQAAGICIFNLIQNSNTT